MIYFIGFSSSLSISLEFIRFFAVSSIIIFFYTNNVQSVDPEEYGGNMEIIKEGLGTAFATFLVITQFH